MGLFLHLSLPICHSQCLSVCLCIILPVRSGISGPHVLVSLGIFVSLCPVCLLFSLSLSLSVHLCLSASVSSLGACLSVCPSFHLRQLKTPLMSHLMCSCAILFECCRSDLTVAKGTARFSCHGDGQSRCPHSAQHASPCFWMGLDHLLSGPSSSSDEQQRPWQAALIRGALLNPPCAPPISSAQQTWEVGSLVNPILQMRLLRNSAATIQEEAQ
uniref:Uncharacterized protein n=1 Tax=Equus caballus TaxID=9796 RepID=A0A3Q2H4Y6_HORSE